MRYSLFFDELIHLLRKDMSTYEHSLRVGRLAKSMANLLHLDTAEGRNLIAGCCLHDIGKVSVPDPILKKESALTKEEWEVMIRHPTLGADRMRVHAEMDKTVIDIIQFHHERWDGKGYPGGLKGEQIPDAARICAIIDAFDCMISDRPYRKRLALQDAKSELMREKGRQFDERYVELFLSLPDEILALSSASLIRF